MEDVAGAVLAKAKREQAGASVRLCHLDWDLHLPYLVPPQTIGLGKRGRGVRQSGVDCTASHLSAQHTSRLGRARHSSAVQGWCAELSKIYLNSHAINERIPNIYNSKTKNHNQNI
jgi:hypothetical protein